MSSPPLTMMYFAIDDQDVALLSMLAMSPVRSQPPREASAVSSGSRSVGCGETRRTLQSMSSREALLEWLRLSLAKSPPIITSGFRAALLLSSFGRRDRFMREGLSGDQPDLHPIT
jgi:hypothetical protein